MLEAISPSDALPALGFGVSADDSACKIYVMNAKGKPLPELPLLENTPSSVSVDTVLPKLGEALWVVRIGLLLGFLNLSIFSLSIKLHHLSVALLSWRCIVA